VVGRTGAGKSSLSVALFRLVELAAGSITIDGVDISSLGLAMLRRAMTIIQQDAMLFAGTIRSNLDPIGTHSDEALDAALRTVDFVRHAGGEATLDTNVAEGGANLSAGTRQLLGVAGALLRHSRIVMLDEATASIDFTTDATIQRVVRKSFDAATILTIAHRLDTVIDYDDVIVMSHGVAAECGAPAQLLRNEGSLFSALVRDTGTQSAKSLRESAMASERVRSVKAAASAQR